MLKMTKTVLWRRLKVEALVHVLIQKLVSFASKFWDLKNSLKFRFNFSVSWTPDILATKSEYLCEKFWKKNKKFTCLRIWHKIYEKNIEKMRTLRFVEDRNANFHIQITLLHSVAKVQLKLSEKTVSRPGVTTFETVAISLFLIW